jgi:hypothetical protein
VADRCRAVLEGTGPAAIAFSTSGQLFAEEYWTLAGRTAADDGLRDLGREAGVRRQL